MVLVRSYCHVLSFLFSLHVVVGQTVVDKHSCASDLRKFDGDHTHKAKYKIAVDATRGFNVTTKEYGAIFSEYLTETAGKRFSTPISFEMVPVLFSEIYDAIEAQEIDFVFANPGVSSCIGVEQGAQLLATKISHLEVRSHEYDLDVAGGVIFARADNDEIETIGDLKDKVIGVGDISMFTASQVQFNEMTRAGLSPYVDPKQVVFNRNQDDVVDKVLSGVFDVGFVTTDQIERQEENANGQSVDRSQFKIVRPQIHILDNGALFPLLHSTDVYPEWPVASLTHVPHDVAEEVQDALLALSDHARSGLLMEQCADDCAGRFESFTTRCETTEGLAKLSLRATRHGNIAGFRPPRSYSDVRTKQHESGFLWENERGEWKCSHNESIYDGVRCPEGYFKLSRELFHASCSSRGLKCPEGLQCYCKPCVESFEVEIFQIREDGVVDEFVLDGERGCAKMSLCGTVEQHKVITFEAIDHRKREGATVRALIHFEQETVIELPVVKHEDIPYAYRFSWMHNETGVALLQVEFDGSQIPQSPFRVQVSTRRCDLDFPGKSLVSSELGECVCPPDSLLISERCVKSSAIAILCVSVVFLVLAYLGHLLVRNRLRKNDSLWMINVDEFKFDDPVAVIGQGSFGVVLRAEYRGTIVAIKHAVKQKGTNTISSSVLVESEVEVIEEEKCPPPEDSTINKGILSLNRSRKMNGSSSVSLGFLTELSTTKKRGFVFPWQRKKGNGFRFNEAILGESFSATQTKGFASMCFPWYDPQMRQREAFISEMRVLSRLRHPCITTVMGAVVTKGYSPMLVMEFLEYGSLTEGLLQNETIHLTGDIILQIFRNIAQGLRYLHSSRPPILHGDLKGKNILIDSRFRAKLCDFGLASKKKNSLSGTPFWLAPEYLLGHTEYNAECDMYSIGIICYEIYSRKRPYEGEEFCDVLRKVCNSRINKRPKVPDTIPPRMADIMKKCWNPSPEVRPKARDFDMILMELQASDVECVSNGSIATKPRTADMLYEIFPKHIADDLQAGKKLEPESHELVTIVFSDIVGFTDLSRKMSPLKVSNMLDRLYLAFDQISRKHDVFKVETIGDAYMGVTNLEGNQNHSHAKLAAEFAIDLITEANKVLIDDDAPEKGCVDIRVGFHSGPVVSNVIGSLNPRYGLFGDTVNVASRMESNSERNRVLCSEKSWKLLKEQAPEMPILARGKIEVKGRGKMRTFWIGEDVGRHARRVAFASDKLCSSSVSSAMSSIMDTSVGISIAE